MLIEMFKLRQKSNRRNAKRKKHYKLTELKNTRPLAMREYEIHVPIYKEIRLRSVE